MSSKVIDKSGWNYTIIENAVVETEHLDIYQKMLYIALKRFANIQTGKAFPGVKRIAVMAGMSERKAREVLGELVAKEYIAIEHRTNQTSIYTILPTPAHDARGHAHGAGGVMHEVQVGHAHGADELKKQELKKDELKKEKDIGQNVADAPALPFHTIIDYLNEKAGTSYRHTSKKTQGLIRARFNEGFKTIDFKTVIDIKTAEWLPDPSMNKFIRPETLFGTKFESYLNQKPKGGRMSGSTPQNSRPVSNDRSGLDW